jgi:putative transposase
MKYPLVLDLAAGSIPVAVTCRVLGFSKQAFYAWCRNPVSQRDWDEAHLINAALDIHRDDPAFGYRFIADELPGRGIIAGENKVARLCSQQRIWSAFAKRRGLTRKAGPPVHDDLVKRQFTAERPDQLWLTDITEHGTAEGKLYLCAVKDVYSNRVVGYSMDSRMTASLAVSALRNAIALRTPSGTIVVHSDRGSQFRSGAYVRTLREHGLTGPWAESGHVPTMPPWNRSSPCSRRTSWTGSAGQLARICVWPSSPGSSAPTTAGAASAGSAASHPSNTRQSTRPQPQPDPPTPGVN